MRKTLVLVVFGVALLEAAAQPGQPSASALLLAGARGRPVEFAMQLSHYAIPVGLEVKFSDRLPKAKPDFGAMAETPLPVEQLVLAFNENHSEYNAVLMDGVVVIRPVSGRVSYLDRTLTDIGNQVTGAMSALRSVFSPLFPNLNAGGGILGSRFVGPEEAGDYATIMLPPGSTVLRALNEIAAQAVQGWLVVTQFSAKSKTEEIVQIGLIHRNGASTTIRTSIQ